MQVRYSGQTPVIDERVHLALQVRRPIERAKSSSPSVGEQSGAARRVNDVDDDELPMCTMQGERKIIGGVDSEPRGVDDDVSLSDTRSGDTTFHELEALLQPVTQVIGSSDRAVMEQYLTSVSRRERCRDRRAAAAAADDENACSRYVHVSVAAGRYQPVTVEHGTLDDAIAGEPNGVDRLEPGGILVEQIAESRKSIADSATTPTSDSQPCLQDRPRCCC